MWIEKSAGTELLVAFGMVASDNGSSPSLQAARRAEAAAKMVEDIVAVGPPWRLREPVICGLVRASVTISS